MNGGKQTIIFENPPVIRAHYGMAGPKEGKGPLSGDFDEIFKDDTLGEKSYEKAECKMHLHTIEKAIEMAGLEENDIDLMLSGDLLNQIITSSFSARELDIPFIGLYNACSTFGSALAIGAILTSSGYVEHVCCSTSSHFSTAERQYRYPLELGTQMTPSAQWTVTGCGCTVLSRKGEGIKITGATFGKVVDYDIKDANNMGAAMAPAAAYTLLAHLKDTNREPSYYDLIYTGDLGILGCELFDCLLESEGINVKEIHEDCGRMIFAPEQKVKMGGSGAGCSSLVFNTHIIKRIKKGELKKILLLPTGALLSKVSSLQGESIPGIAHAISIEI